MGTPFQGEALLNDWGVYLSGVNMIAQWTTIEQSEALGARNMSARVLLARLGCICLAADV